MSAPTALPPELDRRFEALLFDWEGTAVADRTADAGALRAAIESASTLGLEMAVVSGTHVENIDGQLHARPRGPGALHLLLNHGSEVYRVNQDGVELIARLEIGLTDKADSARWYFEYLWQRGVCPEQVLIVGDELGALGGLPGSDSTLLIDAAAGATVASVGVEPFGVPVGIVALHGGPATFSRLLDRQLALRRRGVLPIVSSDPCWTLTVDGVEHESERAHEALLTLADGCLGTRGSVLAPGRGATPAVLMADVYRGHGELSELQPAPLWNRLAALAPGGRARRVLDLHAGLLCQQMPGELAALQFCSLAEPGVAVLRALAPRAALEASPPLVAPPHAHAESQDDGAVFRIAVANGTLEAAAVQSIAGTGRDASLERIAAYAATSAEDSSKPALRRVHRARQAGRERLLSDHRRAWAQRWDAADVLIDGDPELQIGIRLALFHLIACAGDHGEAAVGARALTGRGYRGHVFWDSDVFVLPFLAATHPQAARAILEYRVRRLPAARAAARAAGHAGARFAWESAASGEDVTPRSARDRAGREVAIYTGQREEHIVADVAWAAGCYIDWTGDRAFREGPGRQLLVETARYWASRVERDSDGSAHIRGVIGPDEYHELVDDNAFTNVMARWNLRRAFAETTDATAEPAERSAWLDLTDALVDGYHPDSGLYEQFAGFFALEPLVISEIAPRRPIAADLLLSPERVHQAQVVKQADVLMLHHLVPDEVVDGSLAANLAFYEPRTAHSSSLSPGVHAALLARAGRLAEARAALALTTRIDLDDVSGSTASGVHIAAMGSVWQALALGFLGARPRGDVLELEPRTAEGWERLELRLCFRTARLRVRVNAETIEVSSDRPTRLRVAGGETVSVGPSPLRLQRE